MLTREEAESTRKRNYQKIRELIRISFGLGVNLSTPTIFKDSLRIINVILIVSSIVSMYGHLCHFMRYKDNIPQIAETVCTALQTIISVIKMIYYLFTQRRFHQLLRQAQTHEMLQKLEMFYNDFPGQQRLKLEIDAIMNGIWKDVRNQLLFYICCCTGIISNYFFAAVFINLYHQIKATPNYKHMLPFPSVYPMWEDKGMAFPYYHIQLFLSGCAVYIAGMCAVSFDGVFIVICLHAVGVVKVLNLIILRSTSPQIPKNRRVEYLRYCIYHYQRVYSYVLEIQRIYLHISLSQFLLSLVVYGFVLFELNVGYESDIITLVRMLMYISAAGYELIIYCYNAQRLTTASEETPLAFYSCDWYDETPEFKQLLRMMIQRTNRCFYLKVSWFSLMNLPTLIALFRMSGSYFLLLRNLSE